MHLSIFCPGGTQDGDFNISENDVSKSPPWSYKTATLNIIVTLTLEHGHLCHPGAMISTLGVALCGYSPISVLNCIKNPQPMAEYCSHNPHPWANTAYQNPHPSPPSPPGQNMNKRIFRDVLLYICLPHC